MGWNVSKTERCIYYNKKYANHKKVKKGYTTTSFYPVFVNTDTEQTSQKGQEGRGAGKDADKKLRLAEEIKNLKDSVRCMAAD